MAITVTNDTHYKNIAATLRPLLPDREKCMTPAEMGDAISRALSFQSDLAAAAERDRFWDDIQDHGKRTRYDYAFRFWGGEYIHPKYKLIPGCGAQDIKGMFQMNQGIREIESQYFDFSGIYTTLGSSASTDGVYALFNGCSALEHMQDIGIPATSYYGTWAGCTSLHTIEIVRCAANSYFNSAFTNCSALQNVTFQGILGQNGLDLHWSAALSYDSLCSVLHCLSSSASGKSVTLSLAAVNAAFETTPGAKDGARSDAWAQLAAAKPNWNINLV